MSATNSKIHNLTNDNFEEIISNTDKPVLVDFWATWCGPCKVLGHVLEEFVDEEPDNAVIAKVNIEDAPDLAQRFGIRSIPAILVFKNGEVVSQSTGVVNKKDLSQKIASAA